MSFNFTSFPELKAERLVLKKANIEDKTDIKGVFDLRSSEEINKFVATKRVQKIEEAKDFITICSELFQQKKRVFWLIYFKNEIIGSIVLHNISLDNKYAEIGYKLKPDYQKKGFMSETIKTVLQFGFKKLNLNTIEAFTHKNNLPSIALLEKHNFIFQPERKCKTYNYNRIYSLRQAKTDN